MKPGKLDLPTIWRGCDWGPVTLKWKDKNGDPIDVSQWQAVAQSLKVNLNPSISDGPGGVTQLTLTKAQTANLRLGTENWDWIWQRPAPGQYRYPPFLSGKVAIKEPVSGVNGSVPPPPPPDTPEAIAATGVEYNHFDANWLPANRAAGYRLDLSTTPDFTTFVPGAQNRDVGNVLTFHLTVSPSTTYHYRLRAYNAGGTTLNSNVIHVTTPAVPPPPNDNFVDAIAMAGLSGGLIGTIFGSTRETGEPAGDNSVWYSWRPGSAGNGEIVIDNGLAQIGVYIAEDFVPRVDRLVRVANSIVNPAGRSLVIWPTEPALTYWIRLYKNTGITAFEMLWGWTP